MEADVDPAMLRECKDFVIECRFDGGFARAFLGDRLISDHPFGRFLPWEITLRDWLDRPSLLRIACDDCRTAEIRLKPVIEMRLDISWG
mgnify:CR=1 FL=1